MNLTKKQSDNFKKNAESLQNHKTRWAVVNKEGIVRETFRSINLAKVWKEILEVTFIEDLKIIPIEDVVTPEIDNK